MADDNELFPGADAPEGLPEGLDFGNDVPDDADETEVNDEPAQPADESDADDATADDADAGGDDDQSEAGADDADADGDDEPEAAPSDEQAEPVKGKHPLIPKARLDQALRKQRAAEQQAQELATELAQLRAAQADASQPKPLSSDEIRAKMTAANEALIAGDTEKAAALQAEIYEGLTPRPQAPAAQPPGEVDLADQVAERLAFKDTLNDIYERFPELNENGDGFDSEISEEAAELQQSYVRRGYTLPEATRKAAEAVSKLYDLADRKASPATPAKAEAAKAEQAAKSRAKIDKATRAAPPMTGRADKSEEVAFDIHSASPEEFMALPEAVRERLLGNTI